MTARLEITQEEKWKATLFNMASRYVVEASGKVLGYIIEKRTLGIVTDRHTSEGFFLTKAQIKDLLKDYRARV